MGTQRDHSTSTTAATRSEVVRHDRVNTSLAAIALGLSFAIMSSAASGQGLRAQDSVAVEPSALGPVARTQIDALIAEKEARTAAQQKIDSRVLLTIDATSPMPRRSVLKSVAKAPVDADGRIVVDIDVADAKAVQQVIAVLRKVNGQVLFASERFKSLRARVQSQTVETIAAVAGVRFIDAERKASHNKNTTTQGDVVHKANLVRSSMGYTGNGVKVCVLSDGIDSISARKASGDLPQLIDVLPGQAGSGDEGTAMLEILYDLIPEARLGFATSNGGEAAFAQNVLDLADPAKGGCKVIVDDTLYFSESPFQDGILSQAVNTVSAAGIVYVAAATNAGNLDYGTSGTWEGDFRAPSSMTSPLIPGHVLHEFAPGIAGNAALTESSHASLYWAEPYGAASNDYDLYVLDASMSTVLAASTNTQNGTQSPVELIVAPNGGSFPAGSRIVVAKKIGAQDRMFSVQWHRGRLTYATNGATRGHSAAAGAISVAATPAAGANGPTPPNPLGPYPSVYASTAKVELFSADGPRRVFFDANGNLVAGATAGNFTSTGGLVRNKPDLTAADGVATDTPGFTQFFGTSAAAPHAAAAAAVLKQAFPDWSPQQVKSALLGTALDIQAPGWDRTSGAGIVMPLAALQANGAQAAAAITLVNVVASEITGNRNGIPDSGETWDFAITLGNSGGAGATNVVATLTTSTPGVSITSAPVNYGSIAVNANVTNNASAPFRFSLANLPCGQQLDFILRVQTAQNSVPLLLPISMPSNPGLGAAQTFTYTGAPVAIPDGGMQTPGPTASAGLAIAGVNGNIGKLVLRIDGTSCTVNDPANAGIAHPYVGDLVVTLKAPDGTLVKVVNRMNGGFNDSQNFCNVVLDDAAAGDAIGAAPGAAAPFTGNYRPDSPLAALNGRNPNGLWELQANDFVQSQTGRINRFSLIVAPQTCNASAPPPPANLSQSLDIDGNGQYEALTDGLLVLRYLLGLTGSGLTNGVVGAGSQRTTAADIAAYIESMRDALDVDGNGTADGLTDGLIVLRYLFGMRGATMVDGAMGPSATRTSAQIEAYLDDLTP